jgi:hypothetical protein
LQAQGLPDVAVDEDTWESAVDVVHQITGDSNIPDWVCLTQFYNLCVHGLITTRSYELWNLYHRINGTHNETLASYQSLPADWVDACGVIEREMRRIDKIKQAEARAELQSLCRK